MNARLIGRFANKTIEGINFSHQMAFANASNTRIATEFANGVNALGNQTRAGPRASTGRSRITSRMTTSNHHDIKLKFTVVYIVNVSIVAGTTAAAQSGLDVSKRT
jgi:hypothetical protein